MSKNYKLDQRSPLQRAKDALKDPNNPDLVGLSPVDVLKINTLNSPYVSQGNGLSLSREGQAFLRKHGALG